MDTKKAIVIGSSSGIGRELAKVLSNHNYIVGLMGRREELLLELQKEISVKTYVKRIDISQTEEARKLLENFINEMDGVDLIVIAAGVGFINPTLDWNSEKETIDINVTGFAAVINTAFHYFYGKGSGHIVGITSIAALLGSSNAPAYNASKSFMVNYLKGLRLKVKRLKIPITVTDTQPGFVDTAMAKGENLFWVASAQKAALQIYKAIKCKKEHVYITKRWRLIAWLIKVLPEWVVNKL